MSLKKEDYKTKTLACLIISIKNEKIEFMFFDWR